MKSIVLLILLPLGILAQSTFQKSYGGSQDEINECLNKSTSVLANTNTQGFAICHSTISYGKPFSQGIYFLKLDKNGDTILTKSYYSSSSIHCIGRSVSQNGDGSFILGANFNGGNGGAGLIKIKNNGDTLWCRRFATSSNNQGTGYNGGSLSNNNFFSCGFVLVGNVQAQLCRVDIQGNIVFGKRYSYGGTGSSIFNASIESKDGSIISIGEINGNGLQSTEALIVKTNNLGNIIWAKTYGTSVGDYAANAVELNDKSIVFVGYKENLAAPADYDMTISKIDSSGNLVYSKLIGTPVRQYGCSIVKDSLDNIYALGYSGYTGTLINKLTSSGNLIWQRSYPKSECGNSVVLTLDNAIAFSGMTSLFGAGGWDIFLTKADSSGYISCDTSSNQIAITNISLNSNIITLITTNDLQSIPITLNVRSGAIVGVNCENATSLTENQETLYFKIFPSPTERFVNIESEENIISLELYNSEGSKINSTLNINSDSHLLDMQDLPGGIYLLKAILQNKTVLKKIIKYNYYR